MTAKFVEYPFSWHQVQEIVQNNDLELFARSLPQIEHYHEFKRLLIANGTTVFKHLVANSLNWCNQQDLEGIEDSQISIPRSGAGLFKNANDLKIIPNDFPYNLEKNITHLCVWSKVAIESDPSSELGDISDETRLVIEEYVCAKFVDQLGIQRDHLVWFRNWGAIQSVKEISHIHVLIKDMTNDQLEKALAYPL